MDGATPLDPRGPVLACYRRPLHFYSYFREMCHENNMIPVRLLYGSTYRPTESDVGATLSWKFVSATVSLFRFHVEHKGAMGTHQLSCLSLEKVPRQYQKSHHRAQSVGVAFLLLFSSRQKDRQYKFWPALFLLPAGNHVAISYSILNLYSRHFVLKHVKQ
jgi:hypothetical protein